MATLPTYEYAGAQYANLPSVSTAPQQVAAQGMSMLGQQLDRMTAYFQNQAVTDAQKAGMKYAIELPPTLEQLEVAKKTGQMPPVEGAGRVFQESYNKASAHILGTNIIADFQNRQADRLQKIESGAPVDLLALRRDLRDDIDGNASMLTNLDAETSIQVRAQMTTLGHAVYKQALMFDEKARQASYQVDQEVGLSKIKPVLENVITSYAKINLPAGELEQVLDNVLSPYTNSTSIRLAGSNKYALEAYKIKENAQISVISAKLTDRDFAPTAGAAFKKILAGDAGELTEMYKGMSTDSKDLLRERIIKSFSDQEQTRKMDEAIVKDANKVKGNALTTEYLTAGGVRKRQIVMQLVGLREITLQSAEDLLKPKDPSPNPVLTGSLYDQIRRGTINNFQQLIPFSNQLSRAEFESLSRTVVDDQARKSYERIDRVSGIVSAYVDPGKVVAQKKIDITKLYLEELAIKTKNDQGVEVFQSPEQAVTNAIKRWDSDSNNGKKEKKREDAEAKINKTFETESVKKAGATLPNMPIDKINFDQVKGLKPAEIKILKEAQKQYMDNI
jgi:hypothetical protein